MSRTKEIMTAAGTLACALGIGFVMQSSETADKRYGPSDNTPIVPASATSDTVDDAIVMDVQDITLTSALSPPDISLRNTDAPVRSAIRQAGLLPFPQPKTEKPNLSVTSCNVDFAAEAASGAFVQLSLSAGCMANERVTIHHNGMVFTASTSDAGTFNILVPALTDNAVFLATVAGEQVSSAQVVVPDLGDYNRVVLQWEGQSGFELHAREFGASYGSTGHVWRASETEMDKLQQRAGGYLVSLGERSIDNPSVAEVYTFPASLALTEDQIDLSIEAQVTLGNCGLDIEAETIELTAGKSLRSRTVSFSVPGCDAVGDYLVLNNAFEDLTLAAN